MHETKVCGTCGNCGMTYSFSLDEYSSIFNDEMGDVVFFYLNGILILYSKFLNGLC